MHNQNEASKQLWPMTAADILTRHERFVRTVVCFKANGFTRTMTSKMRKWRKESGSIVLGRVWENKGEALKGSVLNLLLGISVERKLTGSLLGKRVRGGVKQCWAEA